MIQPDRNAVARALRNARGWLHLFEGGNQYSLQNVGFWMGVADERAYNAGFSVWEQADRVIKYMRRRVDRKLAANSKQMYVRQAEEFMGHDKEGMTIELVKWGLEGDDKR